MRVGAAPDWYDDWAHEALHELIDKNERLKAAFKLEHWSRWFYDMDACTLTFLDGDTPKVIADVRLIGSTSNELKNWQWSWANAFWPKPLCEGVDAVREFGEEYGIEELTNGWVDSEDLTWLGWRLSAVGARQMKGLGIYRPRTDNGELFFLYRQMICVE